MLWLSGSLAPVGTGSGEGRPSGASCPDAGASRRPSASGGRLSPTTAIVMALTFGLCAGFLDSGLIVFKRWFLNPEGYYRMARDFPWSVPVGHAALMVIPGFVVAILGRLLPRVISLRAGSWLLATVALWGALLRMPVHALSGLLLAVGVGRVIADAIAAGGPGSRRMRYAPAAALAVLVLLAAASSGLGALRESRAVGALPAPPRARNVVLIVWDTVRAQSLHMYGYARETVPNLSRWARSGVTYYYALAPAPWTFPSHSSFFTGRWPNALDSQWKPRLDNPAPTLAEYLASRGYQTAGFAANTNCCTDESGLGRGFVHYEDYSLTPASILARTVPGQWIVTTVLRLAGRYREAKWAALQSRDAAGINGAFLDWLGRRRADRPFFAYLNYFDAHDPFLPPPEFAGRFGIRPAGAKDYQFLVDYIGSDPHLVSKRSVLVANGCYDDCIAYLDDQLDRLLGELGRRGLLADTDVIITSDHGEAFVEHSALGHGNSVKMEEIRVPLVILSPGAPAGGTITHPVSLRDLPATVVDRLGLAEGSPFPGRSLAAYWGLPPGRMPAGPTTPAFTEQENRSAWFEIRPQPGRGGLEPGFQMSLVAWTLHYIRDGEGGEQLYDLIDDPLETTNLIEAAEKKPVVASFRAMLLGVLNEEPGSDAVERTYLRAFRESLAAAIRQGSPGRIAVTSRPVHGHGGPPRRPAS
jgi:arylsulfatase A-like enzyme